MFKYHKLLTAIAIAISDSVTVSIGDDTSGARNEIFLVNGDAKSTSSAAKSMNPGNMIKSLYFGFFCFVFGRKARQTEIRKQRKNNINVLLPD